MKVNLPSIFLERPIAHRGLHDVADGRPENSRAAFEAAIAHGFGIELDVQLTADAQAVVFHDYHLERLTGAKGVIRQRSADEMTNIPLLGGVDKTQTLKEILDLIDGRVPVIVEIKDQDGTMGTDIGQLENATAAAIRDYPGQIALMSFNPNSTTMMSELCPNIPRGLVTGSYQAGSWPLPKATCDRLRNIPDFDRSGASFISHEVSDLDRPRVTELKSQGARVLCWTVKSQAIADEALSIAENITFEQFLPA